MSFGLSDEAKVAMVKVLTAHSAVERAIIYGSRAKGTFKPGSDIDLTLIGDMLTRSELLSIAVELDDLLLPYEIDLSLLAQVDNPDLLDHIRRVGKLFYERRL